MHWKNCLLICFSLTCSDAFVSDYFKGVTDFFGFNKEQTTETTTGEFDRGVLYEVSIVDEKFISEAAKLTGVALSELDKCQQRVSSIIKRKSR